MQCQQVHRDLDCRFMAPRPRATVSPLSSSPPWPIPSPRGVIWLRCLPGPLRSAGSDTMVLKGYFTAFVVVAFRAVAGTRTSGVRDFFIVIIFIIGRSLPLLTWPREQRGR